MLLTWWPVTFIGCNFREWLIHLMKWGKQIIKYKLFYIIFKACIFLWTQFVKRIFKGKHLLLWSKFKKNLVIKCTIYVHISDIIIFFYLLLKNLYSMNLTWIQFRIVSRYLRFQLWTPSNTSNTKNVFFFSKVNWKG